MNDDSESGGPLWTDEGAPLMGSGGNPELLQAHVEQARHIEDVDERSVRLYFLGRALVDCDDLDARARGLEVLREAAELGSPHAAFDLAAALLLEDPDAALLLFTRAADAGLVVAQATLGALLRDFAPRATDGARWLERARNAGSSRAAYDLALAYFHGRGVERDLARARELCREAANLGLPEAQFELSLMLLWGHGGDEDRQEAEVWESRAASAGHARACLNLGARFATYAAGEPNYEAAIGWYEKAAEAGSSEAAARLFLMFALGEGVARDEVKATQWFGVARELGHKF
jgi:hypothetical protein